MACASAVIAVALACGPKLLFVDEPTTALDVTVQAQLLDLLAEQQRDRFMAMILVTHDLGGGPRPRDRGHVRGPHRREGAHGELFSNMKMPYTEALLSAIPKLADPPHTRLAAIGSAARSRQPPAGCPFAPAAPTRGTLRGRAARALRPVDGNPEHPSHATTPSTLQKRPRSRTA
ncbi:MAG: hypothetical protein R2716_10855 [Microthrixaceae bacterium]